MTEQVLCLVPFDHTLTSEPLLIATAVPRFIFILSLCPDPTASLRQLRDEKVLGLWGNSAALEPAVCTNTKSSESTELFWPLPGQQAAVYASVVVHGCSDPFSLYG